MNLVFGEPSHVVNPIFISFEFALSTIISGAVLPVTAYSTLF